MQYSKNTVESMNEQNENFMHYVNASNEPNHEACIANKCCACVGIEYFGEKY